MTQIDSSSMLVPKTTAAQEASAEVAIRRMAAAAGATDAEVDEVLKMLGLHPYESGPRRAGR